MVLLSDLKPFKIDYKQLDFIAYYYWVSEYILTHYYSEYYSVEVLSEVPGFGAHWGGLVVAVKDNNAECKAVCHTGLVYHPNTETGIYFEAESWKNVSNYKKLWMDIEVSEDYDLNKEESDFIKLFYPRKKVNELMNSNNIDKQINLLKNYYDACFTGIIKAANK